MIEFGEHKKTKQKTIYISVGSIFVIIIIAIALIKLLQYSEEGEKNLPFELSKITIISSADGIGRDEKQNTWDIDILQNNDVYIELKKQANENRNDSLKNVTLENFTIVEVPKKGEIKFYAPINDANLIYQYKEDNLIKEKLEYKIGKNSNVKRLEISKENGIISFSSCIMNLGNYTSNEETEIKYDGSLLNKIDVKEEEIKYNISFDMIVEMESNKKYKATINLKLPLDNVIAEGIVKQEITDFSNIVFKRI